MEVYMKISISNDIKYVGVNDKNLDLFEGQYLVENGMAYNSYVIIDEKIAVLDSVDRNFKDEWLNNVSSALDGRNPDFLIVQHMEPDHSSNVTAFLEKYKDAKIVASARAFQMMKNYFGTEFFDHQVVAKEGEVLSLGKHNLSFISAPMVHWPEVIMTYDDFDKVLFSADAFGKFGALDTDEDWACEARRYYFGIVGKYGAQVQSVLKKVAPLEIGVICPLHGPVLSENIPYYLNLYDIWSSYGVESEGVVIAYTSVYGHTKTAVELLENKLREKGVKVSAFDLARCDMAEAVEDAFKYGKIVLATTTYNGEIFPFMKTFIDHLVERNFQNRTVGFIENGSWAPQASRIMRGMLASQKNLTLLDNDVKIFSAVSDKNIDEIQALADALA